MFQTGSQINPSLGRTDYTAYAQGAIAGGQAIGQGIANLGQGIASGIEQYGKQKKENKMMEAKLKASIKSLEGFGPIAKSISPEAEGQLSKTLNELNDPNKSLAERAFLSEAATATLTQYMSFGIKQKEKEDATTATNLGLASAQSGKPVPLIYKPEILASAGSQALDFAAKRAQIDETKAKTAAAGVPKTPTEIQAEINAFEVENGRSPNAKELTQLFAGVRKRGIAGEKNPYQDKVVDQLFTLDTAARAAPQALENIDAEINLIDSGEVSTGFLGNVNQGINQVRALLGDKKAAKSVTDTQVLESLLGADLLSQIKASGLTTRSFDTPAELENLRKALVGSTQLEPATIKKIALLRKKNIESLLETHGKRIDSGAYDDLYSAYGEKPQKIGYNKQVIVNY